MVVEYDSIIKKCAWEIFPRLVGKLVVGLRWIYKVNQAVDGSVEKHKARFVVKGFSLVRGLTMVKHLHQQKGTHQLDPSLHSQCRWGGR